MNARIEWANADGVMFGMSNADYHAISALSATGLKKIAKSPLHYYATTLDPNRPIIEPTPAMKGGTLAHCVLLEPQEVAARYIVRPDGLDGRTKDGKTWLLSVAPGVECITADQMLTATRQAASIRALPEVAALLADGMAEVSAFWTDEETGVLCKCRPDFVSPAGDGVIITDLKTTQDASPAGYARSIANYKTHLQAAWYCEGYEKASGNTVLGFVLAVVEDEYPHAASAFMIDDAGMDKARAENGRLLALYSRCRRENHWPGYADTIQPIALPAWA